MKNSIARAPCWTTQLRFSKSEFKSGIFLKSEFKGGMFLNCSYNPHVLIGSVKIMNQPLEVTNTQFANQDINSK